MTFNMKTVNGAQLLGILVVTVAAFIIAGMLTKEEQSNAAGEVLATSKTKFAIGGDKE